MKTLTPRQLVHALDEYIIGQDDAKRAVAVAVRNRWRRQQLDPEVARDVLPKNILMVGPTGVGKTEIARRLSDIVGAPFVKVEASKYTEVGYVGRDVESMIRELMEVGVELVKREMRLEVEAEARRAAEDTLLDALLPGSRPESEGYRSDEIREALGEEPTAPRTRERLRQKLRAGDLDARTVRIAIADRSGAGGVFASQGFEQMGVDLQSLMERMQPPRPPQEREVTVAEARELLLEQETEQRLDPERVNREAKHRVEQGGIVFIDEIDKITLGTSGGSGPDVSREGVQRDLLPIVEGSTVPTRYGTVNTDHVLFIAAGAFHVAEISDLIPELQGRFPIRVKLSALEEADLVRILTEPRNALTRQYTALLATEGVELVWTDEAVREMALIAAEANTKSQSIGARRLHTVVEKLLEDLSFDAPTRSGETVEIDAAFVREKLEDVLREGETRRLGF
jgi:ATP-dependent HslUV protease ATP-binding subunit HslU